MRFSENETTIHNIFHPTCETIGDYFFAHSFDENQTAANNFDESPSDDLIDGSSSIVCNLL